MKILHLITSLKVGGAESALYNLLSKLKEDESSKHHVAYFYDGPNVTKIKNLGIDTYKIDSLFCMYDPFFYFKLKKLIKKLKPDIIHSALWSANIFARVLGKKLNIPVLCDLHSNFLYDGKLRIKLEKFFIKYPAKYIAVSNITKDGFDKAVISLEKNKTKRNLIRSNLSVIQNGIDVDEIKQKALENKLTKKDLGFNDDTFVVGAVGRLEPIKSYDLLIKAFALLLEDKKNIKLCLVGDGSQMEELKELAGKLGVAKDVLFVGQRTDAYCFYPLFNCFVLSSQSEGLSISLLEALCFGLPIVSTHRYQKHDLLVNNKNGFLVPVNNEHKLAKAIGDIYYNPTLSLGMKNNNLDLVKSKFEINRIVDLYQKKYKDLIFKS